RPMVSVRLSTTPVMSSTVRPRRWTPPPTVPSRRRFWLPRPPSVGPRWLRTRPPSTPRTRNLRTRNLRTRNPRIRSPRTRVRPRSRRGPSRSRVHHQSPWTPILPRLLPRRRLFPPRRAPRDSRTRTTPRKLPCGPPRSASPSTRAMRTTKMKASLRGRTVPLRSLPPGTRPQTMWPPLRTLPRVHSPPNPAPRPGPGSRVVRAARAGPKPHPRVRVAPKDPVARAPRAKNPRNRCGGGSPGSASSSPACSSSWAVVRSPSCTRRWRCRTRPRPTRSTRARPSTTTLGRRSSPSAVQPVITSAVQTAARKMSEIIVAIKAEQSETEERVMEQYLNTIYFGRQAYGVQASAEAYSHKFVDELSREEAPFLAAAIQQPHYYGEAA